MGVIGMNLDDGDEIIGMQLNTQGDSLLIVSENGMGKRTYLEEFTVQRRGGKGIKCYKITEKTGDVVGVKAVLYDGSYHPVDSSEMAFKTAASQAFKKGFMEAGPVLLEPIASLKVTVPDKFTGDVMGDLNKKRGRILGMNPDHKGNTIIEADIPMSELYGYSTQLRSMTGGSGSYSYEFARYEQAPNDVQEREIAARQKAEEEA